MNSKVGRFRIWLTRRYPKAGFDESVYTALEPIVPGISEFVELYEFDYSAPAEENVEEIIEVRQR